MTWIKKLDKFWTGLLAGLLFPMLMFFFYWLFFHHGISFPQRFIHYLMTGHLLSNVIKICGLGNLLIFYFGLNKRLDSFSKGVILSIVVYIALIAYITYYYEPQLL